MKQSFQSILFQLRPLPNTGKAFCILVLSLVLLVSRTALPADSEGSDARRKEKTFQTELDLAKKGIVYTILDLSDRRLTLKIKGLALKEFYFSDVSSRKENVSSRSAHRLIKKYPPTPTIEKEIPPSNTSEASAPPVSPLLSTESVFVAVGDMPSRYRLYFEDGLMISIVPTLQECDCGRIEKGLRVVKETAINLSWEAGRLVVDRRFPDLRLNLSEEEAKELFWSLSEGSWVLVQSGP
ncbi:MAG: hypothetical protein MPW14_05510 [Candidatus Manganitrophus sp.]|nr:hypothetical protein [Candidatus Manganitrophus sp.]MDC4227145.1 hypothetical protein [Candidatus Manganitrophus sp.]WDT71458.1 MAG: hypothetical protein MPW17_00920 [Candidatus Manganitrophus sp.]WDT81208.1 MAG: hypothetical protein MPW14_05510 [Candidatus Manganitrophus sp.]